MKVLARYLPALFVLSILGYAWAGPYPGSITPHGHTGPGDGGNLANPSINAMHPVGTSTITVQANIVTTMTITAANLNITGTGAITSTGTLNVTTMNVVSINGGPVGFYRNRIINGAMVFNQRYENEVATVTALLTTSTGSYVFDRWKIAVTTTTGVTLNMQVGRDGNSSPPQGFTNYLYASNASNAPVGVGGAQQKAGITQVIEGNNIKDLRWGTAAAAPVTLSFWTRGAAGPYCGSIRNGTLARSYVFCWNRTTLNTWQYVTQTIPGDTSGTWSTDTSTGMVVDFTWGANSAFNTSSGTWTAGNFVNTSSGSAFMSEAPGTYLLTGVQLEKGSVASAYEFKPWDVELLQCQRYYEKSFEVGASSVGFVTSVNRLGMVGVLGSANDVITSPCFYKATKRAIAITRVWSPSGFEGKMDWTSTAGVATTRVTAVFLQTFYGFAVEQTLSADSYALGHYASDADY